MVISVVVIVCVTAVIVLSMVLAVLVFVSFLMPVMFLFVVMLFAIIVGWRPMAVVVDMLDPMPAPIIISGLVSGVQRRYAQ